MSLRRMTNVCALASAVTVCAAVLTSSGQAFAQAAATEGDSVSVTGKGIAGGALLGGEVVMLTMGAIGVERAWPYLVFGTLGAAGGGVGGFFIEDAVDPEAEVPLYMLAGGMALVIPTLVVTLNATSYKPPADDKSEPVPTSPASEPAAPSGSVTVKTSKATIRRKDQHADTLPRVPLALVGVREGEIALGLPAPEVRPLYTRRELAMYGVDQGQEVRLPIFSAKF